MDPNDAAVVLIKFYDVVIRDCNILTHLDGFDEMIKSEDKSL